MTDKIEWQTHKRPADGKICGYWLSPDLDTCSKCGWRKEPRCCVHTISPPADCGCDCHYELDTEDDGRDFRYELTVIANQRDELTVKQQISEREIARLEQWKAEALEVMSDWDKVWVALDSPGKLGESLAKASLDEVKALKLKVASLNARIVSMTWTASVQREEINDLIERIRNEKEED